MIYASLVLLGLALLFDFSVWMWARANPVLPLSPIPDWRVQRFPMHTTSYPAYAVTATSAWAVIPSATASFHPGAVWQVEDPRTVARYNP